MGVFVRELAALYGAFVEGQPSPLPELPIQYADFAVWQRQWLTGEVLEEQLAYWRQRLAGAPAALDLPADRPRPPVRRPRGGRVPVHLPPALAEEVGRLARRRGATPFMVLLAAFDALLARLTGAEDLVVGSPVAGREHAEVEGLIGFFVNTLALRARLAGDPPFAELLARAARGDARGLRARRAAVREAGRRARARAQPRPLAALPGPLRPPERALRAPLPARRRGHAAGGGDGGGQVRPQL